MKCKRSKKSLTGFTLVEIMIVVAIIGIIVGIAVPAFFNSRIQSQAKGCQENQAKLAQAIQEWALSNNQSTVPAYTDLVGPASFLSRTPACPTTGTPIALPADLATITGCPTSEGGHTVAP